MKKIIKILTLFVVLICIMFLTGCQSTDKTKAYMGIGDSLSYTCSYDPIENKTIIKINSYIQNDTIYTIDKVTIIMNLYLNDTIVKKEGEVTFDFDVRYGETRNFSFSTSYANGEINKLEYVSWYATYKSVWNSYSQWFITSIIIASVVLLIFILLMLIKNLELDDVTDFFEEHSYIIPTILIIFVPYLIDGISSGNWSWVPPIIIVGAVISLIILELITLGIKYLFTDVFDINISCRENHRHNRKKSYVPKVSDENGMEYSIEDLKNDKESLKAFSKEDLVEWCREKGLTGYSKLNKSELVDFIVANSNGNDDVNKSQKIGYKNNSVIPNKKGITFNDIAGLEEAKKAFNEKVIMPYKHKKLFEKFGKKIGGGILLYGLPGTGKTMFAEAASNELDALFIPVKCSDIKSKWYGESEQKVKQIFNRARKAKKAIIFFDEFEAIGAKRTDNSENGNNDLVPQILAEMQGVGSSSDDTMILVIAATNKPWSIDSAFMRPGRFDEKIYIPLPDFEARKKIFEIQLSKLPHEDNLDYELLAKLTEGCNGADVKEVCEKLKMSAINDSITIGIEQTIGMDDIEKIKNCIKSSVKQDEIEKLYDFQKNN